MTGRLHRLLIRALAVPLFLFLTADPVVALDDVADGPSAARVSQVFAVGEDPDALLIGTNDGIFRSVDGGDSWQRVGAGVVENAIATLASGDGQLVFAGGQAGLYRSADGGVSWSRVESLPNHAVYRVEVHPDDPGMILVATAGGVFRSLDHGTAWTPSSLHQP